MSESAQSRSALRWRWLLPVALLVVAFNYTPIDTALNWAFFDVATRHPFRSPPPPTNSVLVLVDDNTMSALGAKGVRWPFPRLLFAQLLATLQVAGAEKIFADFTFFETSEGMQDQVLASVAAASPGLVLARTLEHQPVFWPADFQAANASYFKHHRSGFVDFPAERDGVARKYHLPGSLVAPDADQSQPGGLLRWYGGLYKDSNDAPSALERRGLHVYSALQFIDAGQPIIERMLATAPDVDVDGLAKALAAEPPLTGPLADAVRGKVVFVGVNAHGTFDLKPFPIGRLEPGVLMHWTAWANSVSDGFITELSPPAIFGAALLAGAIVLFLGGNRTSVVLPLVAATATFVLLLAGSWMLLSAGWFLAPATPLATTALMLLGVVVENLWREQRRKREIQAMFGAYVDPGVVEQLVRNPDSIRLAGERREATVFFSDLAGFTDLSEKLPAEQMVEVVNAYLEETSECLHRHGAYVDKYIGDAVMAVLGAPQTLPDHALAGCLAALEARRALETVNARYATKVGVKLEVRIGLNTGDLIVGNLGSSRKKQYTVMGDTVNLASRLEGANKAFGTYILLGEETARRVQGKLVTRPLARLRVKGKMQAIEVHTLHGAPEDLTSDENEFVAAYCTGYTAYVERRFADALPALSRALALRPDDYSTRRLHSETSSFAHTPPPPTWEPVVSLDSK